MEFTHTKFEYDFGGVTPQECLTLKAMTAEDLYETIIASIGEFNSVDSAFRKKLSDNILLHVGELYRRNISSMPEVYIIGLFEEFKHTTEIQQYCQNSLKTIRLVKKTTMRMLKAPLLSKQINDLMDEILDKNGNKPSQFKDFLTPDHYRMVRMGCDVSVWSVEEQEVLLACLKKM